MKRLALPLLLLAAWWLLAAHRPGRRGAPAPCLSLDLDGRDRAPDGTPPDRYAG